ncbi:hypothetical protein KEM60_00853 [Austwickia sp. TVS 96-490-7B]|uniref:hypothetical protein n=1 Tax=Austwickia sp. TVS 96-490-7B TaxID=2830843 RepID=UPI001C5669BC|nr:hypothetical protein [Austwickia sp. TVS 96-490-7B]MBW3084664.1 hypothetical protein [Austwickia sp. TVS 96-490-7B]
MTQQPEAPAAAVLVPPGSVSPGSQGPIYGDRFGVAEGFSPELSMAGLPESVDEAMGSAQVLAYRPGVITLRPMDMGPLVDASVRSVRTAPALYLGVIAVVAAGAVVVETGIGVWMESLSVKQGIFGLRPSPTTAGWSLLGGLAAGLLAVPTSYAVLGRKNTLRAWWAATAPRIGALVGYVAVMAAVLVPVIAAVWLGLGGSSAQPVNLWLTMGALAALIEVLRVPFVAAPAAVVLEGLGPWRAVRRSWSLVHGSVMRTFAIGIVLRLLTMLLSVSLSVPFALGVLFATEVGGIKLEQGIIGAALPVLLSLVVLCLTLPFEAALRTLYYTDLRVRTEGFDVMLLEDARRRGRR